jgi:hypothetical protein
VLVQGFAQEVTDLKEVAHLRQGVLRLWGTARPEHWIRVSLDHVTGRTALGEPSDGERAVGRPFGNPA